MTDKKDMVKSNVMSPYLCRYEDIDDLFLRFGGHELSLAHLPEEEQSLLLADIRLCANELNYSSGWKPIGLLGVKHKTDDFTVRPLWNGKVVYGHYFEGFWFDVYCSMIEPTPTMYHDDPMPPKKDL